MHPTILAGPLAHKCHFKGDNNIRSIRCPIPLSPLLPDCFCTPVPSRLISNATAVASAMLDPGEKTFTKSNIRQPSVPKTRNPLGEALQTVSRYSRTSFCKTQPSVVAARHGICGFIAAQFATHPAFNNVAATIAFDPVTSLPSETTVINLLTHLTNVHSAPRFPADRGGKQPVKQKSYSRSFHNLFQVSACGTVVTGKSMDSTRIAADVTHLLHGEPPIHYTMADYNIVLSEDEATFTSLASAYKEAIVNAPSSNELLAHNGIHDANFVSLWRGRLSTTDTSALSPLQRIVLLVIGRNGHATMGWRDLVKAMNQW